MRGRAPALTLVAPAARSLRAPRVPAVLVRGGVVLFLYGAASFLLIGRRALADPQHVCACIGSGDPQIFMWSLAWWPHALIHGLDPVFPHVVWSPSGANLAVTTTIPLPSLLTSPLTAIFGPAPAYTVLTLLSPAVAGTAMYFLCEHLTNHRLASFAGGWLFGFSTYELSQMVGHAHLMLIALLPLAILVVLLRLEGRIGRARFVALIALLLVAQLLTSEEVLATGCTVGLVTLIAAWLAAPRSDRRRIARVGLETVAGGVLAAAVATPWLIQALGPDRPAQLPGASKSGTDLASLVVPLQVTLIRFAHGVAAKLPGVPEQGTYFGVPLLLAFLAALWQRRRLRSTAVLALVAAVAFLFSLGSLLFVAGHPHPSVPLPWRIVEHVPLAQVALPNRLIVYVWLVLAIAVALWLASPGRLWRLRWALALLGIVFILPDGADPRLSGRLDNPRLFTTPAYKRVLPRGSTVLALPFGSGGYSMLWQAEAAFAFRMPEGYVSYQPPRRFANDPVAATLVASQGAGASVVPASALRAFIRRYRVSTILVDPQSPAGWTARLAQLGLTGRPVDGMLVYRLRGPGSASPGS